MSAAETHAEFYRRWSALAHPYFAWQFAQFSPYLGRRVADVGCGVGSFVEHFLERGVESYLGCEPDPELRAAFAERHRDARARLASHPDATTPEFTAELRENKIDTAFSVNVLEHIEDDALAMRRICEGLPRGGRLCLLVPAHPFLYGTLDSLDGHHRRYTKGGILSLVREGSGGRARVLMCRHFNMIASFGWFLKGRVFREKKQENENYRAMNLLLPVVSRLERLITPPFGLSLVLAAELD